MCKNKNIIIEFIKKNAHMEFNHCNSTNRKPMKKRVKLCPYAMLVLHYKWCCGHSHRLIWSIILIILFNLLFRVCLLVNEIHCIAYSNIAVCSVGWTIIYYLLMTRMKPDENIDYLLTGLNYTIYELNISIQYVSFWW